MKVLYVNHTSQMSGAERSLLELIALARVDADVVLACPPGDLMERARALGIATAELSLPGSASRRTSSRRRSRSSGQAGAYGCSLAVKVPT